MIRMKRIKGKVSLVVIYADEPRQCSDDTDSVPVTHKVCNDRQRTDTKRVGNGREYVDEASVLCTHELRGEGKADKTVRPGTYRGEKSQYHVAEMYE